MRTRAKPRIVDDPERVEDRRRDEARHVRVEDRVPGAVEARLDRGRQRLADAQLFLHPLEDQDVRVDGHADREDEAGDAGEGQRHRDEPEDRVDDERVVDEREARDEARQPVVEEHEGHDQGDADEAGQEALVEERLAERRRDLLARQLLDRERQRAELEDGDEVVRLLGREPPDAAGDLDLAVRDRLVDDRCRDDPPSRTIAKYLPMWSPVYSANFWAPVVLEDEVDRQAAAVGVLSDRRPIWS